METLGERTKEVLKTVAKHMDELQHKRNTDEFAGFILGIMTLGISTVKPEARREFLDEILKKHQDFENFRAKKDMVIMETVIRGIANELAGHEITEEDLGTEIDKAGQDTCRHNKRTLQGATGGD